MTATDMHMDAGIKNAMDKSMENNLYIADDMRGIHGIDGGIEGLDDRPDWMVAMDHATTIIMTINTITLMLGMGAATYWREVLHHLKRPWACLFGLVCQSVILPAVGFGLSLAFRLPPFQALGVLVLSCSPGGTFSNFFTYWVDGDIALSIILTAISSVLALGTMPLNLWLYTLPWPHDDLAIPYVNVLLSLAFATVPAVIGMAIRHYNRKWAGYVSKVFGMLGWVGAVSCGVMLILMYWHVIAQTSMFLVLAAALVPLAGFILAYLVAKIVCFSHAVCRTVAIETACQNMVVATSVMLLSFHQPEIRGQMIIFPVLYGLCQMGQVAVGVGLYQAWKYANKEQLEAEEEGVEVDMTVLSHVSMPRNKTPDRHQRSALTSTTPDICQTTRYQESLYHQGENQPFLGPATSHPYASSVYSETYANPVTSQNYASPVNSQAYANLVNPQAYTSTINSQTYTHPINSQEYANPVNSQIYNNSLNSQVYSNSSNSQAYVPSFHASSPFNQQSSMSSPPHGPLPQPREWYLHGHPQSLTSTHHESSILNYQSQAPICGPISNSPFSPYRPYQSQSSDPYHKPFQSHLTVHSPPLPRHSPILPNNPYASFHLPSISHQPYNPYTSQIPRSPNHMFRPINSPSAYGLSVRSSDEEGGRVDELLSIDRLGRYKNFIETKEVEEYVKGDGRDEEESEEEHEGNTDAESEHERYDEGETDMENDKEECVEESTGIKSLSKEDLSDEEQSSHASPVLSSFPVSEQDFEEDIDQDTSRDSPLPYGSPPPALHHRITEKDVTRLEAAEDDSSLPPSPTFPASSSPSTSLAPQQAFGFYHNGVRIGQFSTFGRSKTKK